MSTRCPYRVVLRDVLVAEFRNPHDAVLQASRYDFTCEIRWRGHTLWSAADRSADGDTIPGVKAMCKRRIAAAMSTIAAVEERRHQRWWGYHEDPPDDASAGNNVLEFHRRQ